MNKGRLIIISGPSGVGKTSVCQALLEKNSNLQWSVSATTRPQRKGECDGKDYYFLSEARFLEMIKSDDFAEYAKVYGCYYGTPRETVDKVLNTGDHCLLDIDVQGARKIYQQKRYNPILIFIAPPDFKDLEMRLRNRGSDSVEGIDQRLQNAERELKAADFYHHQIVNNNLENTVSKMHKILQQEIYRAGGDYGQV